MSKEIKTYTTRYLGSKVKLLPWIWKETAPYLKQHNVKTIIDAFSGTGVVSYLYKQKGFEVISNDFLLFNFYMAKALIENNKIQLSKDEINFLLNPPTSGETFIQNEYTDLFFKLEDTKFLDDLHFAILSLDCEYKRAIAFASIAQAILKKAPYGRFTTTKMTNMGVKSIKEYFNEVINEYNSLIIDNNMNNKAYSSDAEKILEITNADAVYFDPPYGGKSFSKYEHFYNFIEIYIHYWKDEPKIGKLKQVKKQNSDFSYGSKHDKAFNSLLEKSNHIPLWIFSYNNNGGLSLENLIDIIHKYKTHIDVKEIEYEYANKVRKYSEFLIFAY